MEGDKGLVPSIGIVFVRRRQTLKAITANPKTSKVILTATLPEDGDYLIVATRLNGDTGDSTGKFTMTLISTDYYAAGRLQAPRKSPESPAKTRAFLKGM